MKTNPARHLIRTISDIMGAPSSHGLSGTPSCNCFKIDFDGYKGICDIIGGELFPTGSEKALPADKTASLFGLSARHPAGRTCSVGEILFEAIEAHLDQRRPGWTDEEGAHGTLEIRFSPRLRITGSITRRFLSSRTSRL